MSYYNPYTSDPYYDPRYRTEQADTGNVMSGMANMAKTMVLYGILGGVASKALNVASRGLARGIQSGAMRSFPKSQYAQRLSKVANPSLLDVGKATKAGQRLSRQIVQATAPYKKALHARRQMLSSLKTKDVFAYQKARVASVFKDRKTAYGSIGSFINKHVIKGSMAMYGVDSLMGQTSHMGLEDKPIWDIPGHVMNYMKYNVAVAPATIAFGALGPGIGALKGGLGSAARNYFSRNTESRDALVRGLSKLTRPFYGSRTDNFFSKEVQQFQSAMEKSFIHKAVHKMKAVGGTFVQGMIENARTYFTEVGQHAKHAVKQDFRASGTKTTSNVQVESLIQDVKQIWRARQTKASIQKAHGRSQIPGLAIMENFEDLASANFHANSGMNKMADTPGGGHLLVDAVARTNDQIKPKSFIAEVLGLKPTRVGDVVNTDYIRQVGERFARYFPERDTGPLTQAISRAYMGPHMFKSGKFHVDLSYFSPKYMLSRASKKLLGVNLGLVIGIPPIGRNMSIGNITGASTFLSQEVKATTFAKDTTGFGFIVDVVDKQTGKTVPKTLAQIIDDSVPEYRGNEAITIIGRKAYMLSGTSVIDLSERAGIKETVIKYAHPDIQGRAGEAKTAAFKRWQHANRKIKDLDRQAPRNMFGLIQRKLDWDVPPGILSAYRKVKGMLAGTYKVRGIGKQVDHNHKLYVEAAENLLGRKISYDKLDEHLPILKELLGHTTQEVAALLKRPTVFQEVANRTQSLISDDVLLYSSDNLIIDRLRQQALSFGTPDKEGGKSFWAYLTKNRDLQALYNTKINFPDASKQHILSHRLGRLSNLTSHDSLITNYVSFEADRAWSPGTGELHPMIGAAKYLEGKGVISRRQANAMRVHAELSSMFTDEKLWHQNLGGRDSQNRDAVKAVVDRVKSIKNDALQDITRYISDTDLREAPHKSSLSMQRKLAGEFFDPTLLKYSVSPDRSPYVGFSIDPQGGAFQPSVMGRVFDIASERLSQLVYETTGLKKNPFKFAPGLGGTFKYLTYRTGQVAAGVFAYRTLDSFFAANPLFDDTSFDAGVTGFVADNVAKTRLATSRIADLAGVTSTAKYLEGLMPGFTSSAPGAIMGAALNWKGGVLDRIGGAFKGAIGNRILSPMMPDMTKDYEQLQAEYSGESEVPIVEGKMWFLGTTPWQGRRVVGWQPNWYVRAKSRWRSSDSLYGSEFRKWLHEPVFPLGVSIGDFIDPYFMERKHYFSRPYPETGDFGSEMPLGIGPAIAGTVGRILKPKKLMHSEFLHGTDYATSDAPAIRPPTYGEHLGMMRTRTWDPNSSTGRAVNQGAFSYTGSRMYSQQLADKALDGFENAMGLMGFGLGVTREGLTGKPTVMPTLETAGRIASQSRAYYDMNLGGLGIYSEVFRRFVEKPDWRKYGINPIPNLMPNWLPSEYTKGDPFAGIIRGELRLPGPAYEKTHADLTKSMPGRASMLGGNAKDMIKYFTGYASPLLKEEYDILETGTKYHEFVQNWLASENLLIKAEEVVYDAKHDVSGHVDAIIRGGQGGRGRRALEIKTISDQGLEKLDAPKYKHVGQLNFYLKNLNLKQGSILYVSRDNPAKFKVFDVHYSYDRYTKDMKKLDHARQIASQMLAKGIEGDAYGYSYSWIDRMYILADVAPYSKEYTEAKSIVQKQIKEGMLTQKQISKFEKAEQHRKAVIRKYELYPLRFKGRVMSPDTELNLQSINENIKAAAEYSLPERAIGAAWETFTNLNTPLVNKFFAFKDPLEHYKMFQMYGKEYTPWTDPWGSWLEPMGRNMAGQTSILGGAVNWGLGAPYMLGGRAGGIYGAIAGGAFGAAHGMVRRLTNSAYIPGNVQKERAIEDYFDQLKFARETRAANLGLGLNVEEHRNQARATLTSILNYGGGYADFFKSVAQAEKPYIESFLKETDPQRRKEIRQYIPEKLGFALESYWQNSDSKENTNQFIQGISEGNTRAERQAYSYTSQELDPNIELEDIKLKTIQKEGLNAHDFGLGWQTQMMRVQNDLERIEASDLEMAGAVSTEQSPSTIRYAISNMLSSLGIKAQVRVNVNNTSSVGNYVQLTIQRDNLKKMLSSIDNRQRFL